MVRGTYSLITAMDNGKLSTAISSHVVGWRKDCSDQVTPYIPEHFQRRW